MTGTTIRTCIIDDEPLARERIRTLLSQEPDVEVVGESGDGGEAVDTIRRTRPDLVFLDVQMPVMDGFGVLQTLATDVPPAVVFCTAYDQYALQAFDVHALDYLLKPFNGRRFKKAMDRARLELMKEGASPAMNEKLLSLLETLRNEKKTPERLVLKSSGRVSFLKVDEIDWIEAEGNYVRLHTGNVSHLLRETMKGIEAKLDPERYIRIHRSTIVNTDRIKELQPLFHGEYAVILRDGTRLTASRGPENKLRRLIEASA
jgi:two-component system LytT family response regulator